MAEDRLTGVRGVSCDNRFVETLGKVILILTRFQPGGGPTRFSCFLFSPGFKGVVRHARMER